jgi:hypothetical protein
MPRIWQSGFETGDATLGISEFDGSSLLTSFSFDTTIVNPGGGVRSGKFTGQGHLMSTGSSANNNSYVRFFLRIGGNPTARRVVHEWVDGSFNQIGAIYLKPQGDADERKLELFNGSVGTSLGLTTTQLTTGQWYMVEVFWPITSGARLKLDGALEIPPISSSFNNGSGPWRVSFGPRDAALGCDIWIDDCAWNGGNQVIGNHNNFWCGDGRVVMVVPSGDVTPNNWTAVGAVGKFNCINDFPGTVDTTTYIESTSATNNLQQRWTYTLRPSTASGDINISAICYGVRGGSNGTTTLRSAQYIAFDSNGLAASGTNVEWNVNGFTTVFPILVMELDLNSPRQLITGNYLDGLSGAAVDTNTSTRSVRWTAVWASVDFQPPGVPMQTFGGVLQPLATIT